MPFSALLDANVLIPSCLRDTLLRIAEAGLYRPLWSVGILDETRRHILELAPTATKSSVDRMFQCMNAAFDDALVEGYEPIVSSMKNNAKDRHVLAAAAVGRADVIVSDDRNGFPTSACAPFHIECLDPDDFLLHQFDLAPQTVTSVIREQSADTGKAGKPAIPVSELLQNLARCGAPAFTHRVSREFPDTSAPHQ
ncbi:PIN domain-containing protein [Actinocatenispora thailandica]|uniref:PIN domain-containing protein n=1 Tax=Actinocatenispora thailandica TaxID=227318 RepID=A0A7R7DUK8_9ACTN|nr:PIN domain-containing protein [Actinocatenispora thailandica]BCJ37712.1 PIN domain-containing protein [Actinocatenispora thailandica]